MPQVTVYIREDDLDKWKALEKKSEFIHTALNKEMGGFMLDGQRVNELPSYVANTVKTPKPGFKKATSDDLNQKALGDTFYGVDIYDTSKVLKTPKDAEKAVGNLTISAGFEPVKLCKIHGTPLDSRGKCLQKGCKYS